MEKRQSGGRNLLFSLFAVLRMTRTRRTEDSGTYSVVCGVSASLAVTINTRFGSFIHRRGVHAPRDLVWKKREAASVLEESTLTLQSAIDAEGRGAFKEQQHINKVDYKYFVAALHTASINYHEKHWSSCSVQRCYDRSGSHGGLLAEEEKGTSVSAERAAFAFRIVASICVFP